MAVTVIRLGPGECPDIQTGARYFAALAFPTEGDKQAREAAIKAWVGTNLNEANRVDSSDKPFEDTRLHPFVGLDPAWCKAQLRTTRRRLGDRAFAARAVRPWVRDLLADPHGPVPGIRKFTQRQIALHLCQDNVERADNFQKRIWRPSRPAMHLAIAQDLVLSAVDPARTYFPIDLTSPALFRELVQKANLIAPLIVSDARFGVQRDNLMHLEWIF